MATVAIDNAEPTSIWTGVFWKVISCAFFAGINALARYLAGGSNMPLEQPLPVYTIMFFQNMLGSSLLLLIFLQQNNAWKTNINLKQLLPQLLPNRNYWLHFIRVASAALGVGLWYLSLKHMPITEVVALSFIAPTLTVLGAIILLKEKITWQRIAAFLLTTCGGFLMTRPDLKLQHATISWIMLLPLLAALIFAFDKLLTRKLLALGESPLCVTFVLLAFMAPVSLTPCLYLDWITPSASNWPWLGLLALLGVGAHFSFSKAYHYAEVTALLPFGMSKIVLCSVIGYLAFGEYPRSLELWLGIILLTGCTIIFKYHPEKAPIKCCNNLGNCPTIYNGKDNNL